MVNYPIHSVQRYKALALEDLTPGGNLQFNGSPYKFPIVESYKSPDGGRQSYVVVQQGELRNGEPKYVAYTNDDIFEQELSKRMRNTYLQNGYVGIKEYQDPMEKYKTEMARQCLEEDKSLKVISNFDPNSVIFVNDRNGSRYYMNPELVESLNIIGKQVDVNRLCDPAVQAQVSEILGKRGLGIDDWNWAINGCGVTVEDLKQGLHIQLQCSVHDVDRDMVHNKGFDIPHVQRFAHQDGNFIIDSRGSRFTNIDCVQQYKKEKELSLERNQDFGRSF